MKCSRLWFVCSMGAIVLAAGFGAALGQEESEQQQRRRRSRSEENRPIRVHDPSTIVKHNGVYWTFTTGRGVSSLKSTDLVHWERGPSALPDPPDWITDVVPDQRGFFWAPDVIELDGRFLLYYSVSAFGKRTSAIGLAISPSLDPDDPDYGWEDHGIIVETSEESDHNAIDPGVLLDEDGRLWMTYGSFWSGIKLVELDPATGKRIAPDSPLYSLAHKEQIEAANIVHHDGYYYLLLNWGWCCRGVRSTYNIRVGRSREITGPYVDQEGADMLEGGGTLVLDTEGRFIGPGHPGILRDGDQLLMSYHFYDREQNGRSALAIRPIEWTEDGWPQVAGPPITPPQSSATE